MRFFVNRTLCLGTLCGCALLCTVSGCAPQKASLFPDPIRQIQRNQELLPETDMAMESDGNPLSKAELEALYSTGEVDRNLTPEEMREVALFFRYYVHTGRAAFTRTLERVQLYAPYVRQVLREKNMPQELAWLAIVESGYRTQVESRAKAKGMWQFMPYTGKRYGLEQDWWIDERCDFYKSSHAAAEYLGFLYGKFDDWQLAIAAYNAGEGKIERALQGTGTNSFSGIKQKNHQLTDKAQLRDETKQYVPRFMAVCKVMRNLEKLGFEPIRDSDAIPMARVELRPSTDLLALSQTLDIPWDEFQERNGAFKRHVSPPDKKSTVYVPGHKKQTAQHFVRTAAQQSGPGWKTYTVRKGDTLKHISSKTGMPVAELQKVCGISKTPKTGTRIAIPGGCSPAYAMLAENSAPEKAVESAKQTERIPVKNRAPQQTEESDAYHIVQSGDTLYSICQRYNVSVNELSALNNLSNANIRCGQKLKVNTAAAAPQRAAKQSTKETAAVSKRSTVASAVSASDKQTQKQKTMQYRVQSGDTMWAIARKFNVSAHDLIKLNNMETNSNLKVGDLIMVVER